MLGIIINRTVKSTSEKLTSEQVGQRRGGVPGTVPSMSEERRGQ